MQTVLNLYYQRVWSRPGQSIIKAMNIVEKKVHEIAKRNGIKVIGSYNPNNIGCLDSEFYNSVHPMEKYLLKLYNFLQLRETWKKEHLILRIS
jgi:predicted amino acid racemase